MQNNPVTGPYTGGQTSLVDKHQSSVSPRESDDTRVTLDKYLCRITEAIEADGAEDELSRVRDWIKYRRYYEGRQLGFISAKSGNWVDIKRPINAKEPLYVNNQFSFHVNAIVKEWLRSNPELVIQAFNQNNEEAKGAARLADNLLKFKQRKIWKATRRVKEALMACLCGTYFRYGYYDKNLKGYVQSVEQTEKRLVQAHEELQPVEVEVSTGFKKVHLGDTRWEIPDSLEIKVANYAADVPESSYLLRRRLFTKSLIRHLYPNAKLANTAISSPIANYLREVQKHGGTSKNSQEFLREDKSNKFDGLTPVEFKQVWLEPHMYSDYVTVQDEQCGDQTIPAGTKLIEVFPEGLYYAQVGEEILETWGESKNDCWRHQVYHMVLGNFYGRGLFDLVELQDMLNKLTNLRFANMMANASPTKIINPMVIDPASFSGKPNEIAVMKVTSEQIRPMDAIHVIPGMGSDRETFTGEEGYKQDMQVQSGAWSTSSGVQDVNIKTARGTEILRDQALSNLNQPLALRAELDEETARMELKLIQRHYTPEQLKPYVELTDAEIEWFKNCDIDVDLDIYVKQGSWYPRSDADVKYDFISFTSPETTGMPLGFLNQEVPEEIRRYAAELFKMPADLMTELRSRSRAYNSILKVLEQAKLLIGQGLLDPQADEVSPALAQLLSDGVPVDVFIDDHEEFVDMYVDWLQTEDGQNAPEIVKEVLKAKIMEHREAQSQVEAYLASQQMKSQIMAQQLAAPEQPAQEAPPVEEEAPVVTPAQ